MMADEVGRLDNRKEIVFVRGQYPVLDWKYQTFKTPEFKESQKLGHYMKIEREEFDGMHFMNEKEVEHIRKNDENSNQVILTWTDVMGMDISLLSETDPDGPDIDLEEIFAETKEERRASFEAETQMRAEIAEKEAAIEQEKMKDGQEFSTHENPQNTMSYAERMVTFTFTESQKNQAMLGVEHRLPEDIILQYFRIAISAENMALMREVAEKTLKSKLEI